jgi:hypothetical protein
MAFLPQETWIRSIVWMTVGFVGSRREHWAQARSAA